MGLLQTIGLRKKDIEAQLSPPIMQQTYGAGVYTFWRFIQYKRRTIYR
jgi:hypothetical protein